VTGKVITYFVDDDRSVVTGGGDSRVEATIHPKPKGDGRSKKGNVDKR
jgi:lipopolysaccharide export system protein LptA